MLIDSQNKILIYGYGNPGRQDDALGILLVEKISDWINENNIKYIETDSNYQLNIEDSLNISNKKLVVFADASKEDIDSFSFSKLEPSSKVQFTTHSASPSFVLNLCYEIYGIIPDTYLLHIKGYKWNFMKSTSKKSLRNINKAYDFLIKYLSDYLLKQLS